MPTTQDMRWFKENFQAKIQPVLPGTPFTEGVKAFQDFETTGTS